MGIRSASSTFTRFYVPEPSTEDFWGFVDERIRAGAFKECEEGQELSTGFSSWDDLFDSGFSGASYHKGSYVAFQFRMDQRRVPAILVKQHLRREVEKYKADHEGHLPPRSEKQQIKENVQAWLASRTLPLPSACEVVWNSDENWLLFGSTSNKAMESFLELFEKSFHVSPQPLYHVHWALHTIPLEGRHKDHLVSLVNPQSIHALDEGRFLGYEFLTWLWYLVEASGGGFGLDENRSVEIDLGERLTLTRPDDGKERVICKTQAQSLHEARTALKQGKLVEDLQYFFKWGEEEYSFNLDTSLWPLKGLKTPKQARKEADEEDEDGLFLEKMYFLEKVFECLNALYGRFLTHRLSPRWDSDVLPAMKEWMGGEVTANAPF